MNLSNVRTEGTKMADLSVQTQAGPGQGITDRGRGGSQFEGVKAVY